MPDEDGAPPDSASSGESGGGIPAGPVLSEDSLRKHNERHSHAAGQLAQMEETAWLQLVARNVKKWRQGCDAPSKGSSLARTPPGSPTSTALPVLEGAEVENMEKSTRMWLEVMDKQRFMQHPPPTEVGYIHCKIEKVDGDNPPTTRRVVMRLASNMTFLAHAWQTPQPSGCCVGGGPVAMHVSRGPEKIADPQCHVYELEGNGNVCVAAPHGAPGREAVFAKEECICFCAESSEAAPEGDDGFPTVRAGVLAQAARGGKRSAGVIRAARVAHAGVADFPAGSLPVVFAYPSDDPLLIITRYPHGGADLSFRQPLSGYQALAAFVAWMHVAANRRRANEG